jgi:hypothetical protein
MLFKKELVMILLRKTDNYASSKDLQTPLTADARQR